MELLRVWAYLEFIFPAVLSLQKSRLLPDQSISCYSTYTITLLQAEQELLALMTSALTSSGQVGD